MASQSIPWREIAPSKPRPALVVVDDRDQSRSIVVRALQRRFGADYDVVEARSARDGAKHLDRLRSAEAEVALILAHVLLEGGGTAFLGRTREAHPTARRVVLSLYGDNWVLPAISRASAVGEVDHWDYIPASESDEHFLASIGEILSDWAADVGRGEPRITVVGTPGDPQYKVVLDVLERWEPQPIRTLEAGSPQANLFLQERGIDGPFPIVVMTDGRVVKGASIASISDSVGSGADPGDTVYDVAVLGLGPAGFSAAVNAASEGLRTILINDTFSQASSSPLVRNYLGFPGGITGAELMRRAWAQSMLFGAEARIGRTATGIRRRGAHNVVTLDDGAEVAARAVLLATGADYRRIGVEHVDRLVGRGVFYGYGAIEAQAMRGADAAVIGGANSAVQAALHVARYARSVQLIVRAGSLDEASDYLVTQVDGASNITVHLDCEVVDAKDEQRLRSITLRNRRTGETREVSVSGLFVMIGAVPRTDWLPAAIARDARGYVLTGADGPRIDGPDVFRLPFETTMPGVFALGDVRAGSVKRIAAAVGEGSAAVSQVHRYLERLASAEAAEAAEREPTLGERLPADTMQAEIAAAGRR